MYVYFRKRISSTRQKNAIDNLKQNVSLMKFLFMIRQHGAVLQNMLQIGHI